MNFRHRRKYTCCHKQCPHKNKIHLQSPVRCLWFSFTYVPPEIVISDYRILFDFPLPFNVLLSFQFLLNPCHNHIHKIVLLHLTQSPSRLHLCHFRMHSRQQVAVACCAINTGCPRIGVCFPSFGIYAGASLFAIKSSACFLIVSSPFSFI